MNVVIIKLQRKHGGGLRMINILIQTSKKKIKKPENDLKEKWYSVLIFPWKYTS